MEESFFRLLEGLKNENITEIDSSFLSFIEELKKSIQPQNQKSFFSRIFHKTNFEDSLKYLRRCLDENVFSKLSYLVLVRSINDIFPYFIKQSLSQEIYKQNYVLYLEVLSSLSNNLKKDDLIPFANILYRSTFLISEQISSKDHENKTKIENYITNQENNNQKQEQMETNSQIQTPENIENDHFIHELMDLLLNYIKQKGDIFDYWWSILCYSILSPLTQSPTYNKFVYHQSYFIPSFVEQYDFNDFDLYKIFDFLIVSLMKKETNIFFEFPNIFLRVCYKVFISKSYYIDHFFDHIQSETLAQIFQKSIDENVDLQCVSQFLISCFSYVGSQFKNQNNNSAEYLKAKHMFRFLVFNVWKSFYDSNPVNADAIISYLSEDMIHNPHHFLLFSILLLLFVAGISKIPDTIVASIAQMDSYMKSAFSAFSCVLGCVFAHQYLNIDKSVVLPCDMDCITYLVHNLSNSEIISQNILPETMKIIRGIFVTTNETKTKDESMEYIDQFFKSWECNEGLLIGYSCFTDTLISIVKTLPNDYQINILDIFSDFLLRFLGLCESVKTPYCIYTCVSTVINILLLKNTFLVISPAISFKLTIALLRLICLDDNEITLNGVKFISKAILSGNPTFFACSSFLLHYLWQHSDILPDNETIAAVVGSALFFRKYPQMKKNVNIVENRISQFLHLNKDKISQIATDYFIFHKKRSFSDCFDPGFDLYVDDSIASSCDMLLACLWKRHVKSMEIFSSVICLSHCLISAGFVPRPELMKILFLGTNLKKEKMKMENIENETENNDKQVYVLQEQSENHSNMQITKSSDSFLILKKKDNPFIQSLVLGLDCLIEIIGDIQKLIPSFYTEFVNDLEFYFSKKQDVSILFLITNILIITSETDKLISFYKSLQSKIPENYDVFCDLIMLYLGKLGKVSPSSWQCISLDGAIAIGLTSPKALQVIEAAGDLPVVISTVSSSRSAYTFSLVKKDKTNEEIKVPIKYDPKYQKEDYETNKNKENENTEEDREDKIKYKENKEDDKENKEEKNENKDLVSEINYKENEIKEEKNENEEENNENKDLESEINDKENENKEEENPNEKSEKHLEEKGIDENNQENKQNQKESETQITNEFEIFIDIKNAILESGKNYLLSTPKDITDTNSEISSTVSPISSDTNSDLSVSLKDSLGIDFDATFAALKSLCLFGDYGFEASLPQDFRELSSILSKQWKENAHVPVFYSPFNSKSLQDSIKLSWKEVPTIFQQFCSSLGSPSKNGTMVYHSTWGADINFEIVPLINSSSANSQNTSLSFDSNINKRIQIIWYEREITQEKLNLPNLYARICILPLRSGLIRVDVITKEDSQIVNKKTNSKNIEHEIHKFGPLSLHNIVCPQALPALIRSTVATLISKQSKLFTKSKVHSYERDNTKLQNIYKNIIIQESQY